MVDLARLDELRAFRAEVAQRFVRRRDALFEVVDAQRFRLGCLSKAIAYLV
jgi:hypothetical protein